MTPREVPRIHAVGALPDALLLSHLAVVVNAGVPPDHAAATVWDVARAVAGSGRRIALVDLHVAAAGLEPPIPSAAPGISEAFSEDRPLQDVTHELDPGLFYVGPGAGPADRAWIWAHQRWGRLARGFESEGALLLLYLPSDGLAHLSVKPDRLVLLTSDDYAADRASALALAAGLDDGPDVIVIMHRPGEGRAPAPFPAIPTQRPSDRRMAAPRHPVARRPPASRRRTVLAAAGLGAVSVAAVLLLRSDRAATAAADANAVRAPDLVAGVRPPDDSLFYAVQVAAFKSGEAALAQAASYDDAAGTVTVAPVRLGQLDTWHRLLVGAFATPAAAESALAALWEAGSVERPNGTILRTPHALAVGSYPDTGAARAVATGLRARGVAAYIAWGANGTARLLVGAFETSEQARLADSMLGAAGLTATLVPRAGTTR